MNFQQEFPQETNLVYLNHAAVGPWPHRTRIALNDFALENTVLGATQYPNWMTKEAELREQLRQLVNAASVDEIALLKNTSEALSVVAYGLTWSEGDEILISDEEFPSNRIVWESLQEKFGVKVLTASVSNTDSPEQNFIDAITANTKLVSISSTQYASGISLDLKMIGQHCRRHNILFCVDAIQSIGARPFDVQEIYADFAMADGHKWMLGPEGVAVFYCRHALLESLEVQQYGWHMIDNPGDYAKQTWSIAKNAKRFECGSPNMLGAFALSASLSLLLEVGTDAIHEQILKNVAYLEDAITSIKGVKILSTPVPRLKSGILTFEVEGVDSNQLYQALMKERVICANRGGGVRFSPHFYHEQSSLDRGVDVLQRLIQSM